MTKSIRERAMDLLARREHSRQELFNKLIEKGFESEDIEAVIARLLSENLLNDLRFAETYTHYRGAAGFGPLRIAVELKERGVEKALIDQAVRQSDTDWDKQLCAAWCKKYHRQEAFGSKAYAAQLRFLSQRGFMQEAIHQLLENSVLEQ